MRRITITRTPEFERDLELLVRRWGLPSRSAAIRKAVQEAATPLGFLDLLGAGCRLPAVTKRRTLTEDDLWLKKGPRRRG